MDIFDLPRGAGTAIFPAGGAWLPRSPRRDPAVVLRDPTRILTAVSPDEVPALLDEIEAEQAQGCYVAGYLAYEAGAKYGLKVRAAAARPLPPTALPCDSLPLAWMAVYPPESATLVPFADWERFLAAFDESRVAARVAGLTPVLSVSEDEYTKAIAAVRAYIAAGDTYQANYTVRARYDLNAPAPAVPGGAAAAAPALDPLEYFLALVVRQAVPYAAYLDLGDAQVLSLSPELFLRREGELLESRPMKGTRPRSAAHALDVALAYELAETEKERAENLMILDMVRNDLGRVSRTGTIHVPALFTVEPYRTVWQMTSTVQGLRQAGTSLGQIMRAVFPGASITGAPKHHTMEIIAEVETEPRGVYTGTVALFSPGCDFTGNIGIRTIVHRDGRCVFGVGSGIVWDAQAPAEYEETLTKGAFALAPAGGGWRPGSGANETGPGLFETMLLQADGTFRHVEIHLARMSASAQALGLPFDAHAARNALATVAVSEEGPLVVRLDLDAEGLIALSIREAPAAPAGPVSLLVSPFRTDPDDPLLVHKTTRRGFYDREHRRAVAAGCFDALFLNGLDRVTEGGITNVFARFGDGWVTPPVSDGLLPGVWRSVFLRENGATERTLTLEELLAADEIVVGNSVRGPVMVEALLADPVTY
jgi:para-aminobenzoate synthetase / 4-amino-4-deoxychorismate lyase